MNDKCEVGTIVWYQPPAAGPNTTAPDPGLDPGDQMLAAIITHVVKETEKTKDAAAETLVNLTVCEVGGATYGRSNVKMLQSGDIPATGAAFCEDPGNTDARKKAQADAAAKAAHDADAAAKAAAKAADAKPAPKP